MAFKTLPLSTLFVAGSGVLFLFLLAAAIFVLHIFHLENSAEHLAFDVHALLKDGKKPPEAIAAGEYVSGYHFERGLIVVLMDQEHRSTVFPDGKVIVQPVHVKKWHPDTIFSQTVVSAARIYGLHDAHSEHHTLLITIKVNDLMLASDVEESLVLVGVAGLIIIRLAQMSTQSLGNQALLKVASQTQQLSQEREQIQASMRRFIADAGHQLRTPLTVIRGYVGVLRQNDISSTDKRILDAMLQQCTLLNSMMDQLILLEQWEEEQPELRSWLDLGEFVHEIVDPVMRSQPTRSIRYNISPAMYAVVQEDDFRHAVTNIVENALKYTSGAITINVRAQDGRCLVEIADEGPGMKPQEAEHAFDRFFRGSRRNVEGTGLGLAIAKRAVERSYGTIALQTSLEQGSCFTITLPQKPMTSEAAPAA